MNPTYWPGLIIRMLIMGAIAGMYALVTSSRIKDPHFRTYMVRFCAKWLLPIFILGPIVSYFYLKQIPQAAVDTIFTGIQTSGVGNFSVLARALYLSLILSGTIVLFAFFWSLSQSARLYFPHRHSLFDLRFVCDRHHRMDA